MLKTFAAMALTLATLVGPAAAQEPRGAAMVTRLLEAVPGEAGLTAGASVRGQMSQGSSQTTNLSASGGAIYFIGVCDENCSDLDMIVRDPSGREVGRDFELDDVPMVVLDRAPGGAYSIEVSMAGCTGRCHWGVSVYR